MTVLAWFLLVLCSFATLSALWTMMAGESSAIRFLNLFLVVVYGACVYVALTYLYFAHQPYKFVIIAVAVVNGIIALASLMMEEPIERVFGFLVRVFYCVGFLLLL
jgi:hypothetical protein